MKSQTLILALLVLVEISWFLTNPQKIFGQSSSTINATVKISICGNSIAESGEDCDNSDLANETCRSLGFDAGDLSCDIACSFETAACYGVAPTPTPTPVLVISPVIFNSPTPTPGNQTTTGSSDADSQTSVIEKTTSPLEQITIITSLETAIDNLIIPQDLPTALRFYDLNLSGKLEREFLFSMVKIWVTEWRTTSNVTDSLAHKNCDTNNDGICDLADFSILLAHIEE